MECFESNNTKVQGEEKLSLSNQINNAQTLGECERVMSIEDEAKRLYKVAASLSPGELMRLVRRSNNTEEQKFFAYIADMNLQRVQKKVIENNLF